ncbi:MAG: signal recognition particle-docking protein FtsY [Solirubrobacterales bacterium]
MATTWADVFETGRPPGGPSEIQETEAEPARRGAFARLRESLSRSRRALASEIGAGLFERIDSSTWERLEEALVMADVGVTVTASVVGDLEREVEAGEVAATPDAVRERLVELLAAVASIPGGPIVLDGDPSVILLTGVNGSGKTTSAGKLAWRLREEFGLSVLLGAADTYRAAAGEQLEAWADRAGAGLVSSQQGADPGAVAFDAIAAGKARGVDVVIIDTAGRLQTEKSLMDELAKVRRVVEREAPGAPHGALISIDATTGQNGLRQAMAFSEAVPLDGVVLTKLDGSAKGGIALAITSELGIPVRMVGVGEGIEDLTPFDPGEFARALLDPGE